MTPMAAAGLNLTFMRRGSGYFARLPDLVARQLRLIAVECRAMR